MSSLILKDTGNSNIPKLEPGTYPGICTGIIDLGMQYSKAFNKEQHQVVLKFELPGEQVEINGKLENRNVYETYTFSFNEKSNLRKMLQSWRGKAFSEEELQGFDLEKVLGLPCFISIINETSTSGNSFSKIAGISKPPKGFPVLQGNNEPFIFELVGDKAIAEMQNLPTWIQDRIRESNTYKSLTNQTESFETIPDDDLPF